MGFTREDLDRSLASFAACYADRPWGPLVVVRTANGAVLGETGLYVARDDGVDTGEIELGHRYGPASWGQGYGFEAASAVMEWAEKLGFTLRETKVKDYANVLWYAWRSR